MVTAKEENDIDAEFQAVIKSNDEQHLKALCDARSQSKDPSISSEDKETWAFMSILFSDDARRRMLEHLNFSGVKELGSFRETNALDRSRFRKCNFK